MKLNQQKLVFGKQTVKLLLATRADLVTKLFCLPNSAGISTAQTLQLPYQICSKTFFTTHFNAVNHQGIVVQIKNGPINDGKQGGTQIQTSSFPNKLILILDHLEDSYNLGAIIRSAVAYNVAAIILPKRRQISLNPLVAKTSTGACFCIPILIVPNLAHIIKQLQTTNFGIITTTLKASSLPPLPANLENVQLALIIGNEEKGVSHQLNCLADFNLVLPMQKPIASLNVSVATGISLYAIRNQQKRGRN